MQKPPLVEIPFEVALGMMRFHVAARLLREGKRVKDLFDDENYTPALVAEELQKYQSKVAALQL